MLLYNFFSVSSLSLVNCCVFASFFPIDIGYFQCYNLYNRTSEVRSISKLQERRNKIIEILSETPICSTQQLADATNVSTETMRKDLEALQSKGSIIKVHGGVAKSNTNGQEIPFDLRVSSHLDAKHKIALKAVDLISPNETVLIESGTTNLELAKQLITKPKLLETLIIITNSFPIASLFDGGRKCKKMFFLGGWVNINQYSALGSKTAEMIKDFHVSKAFLSAAAISRHNILTAYYDYDAAFQQNALEAAQEVILLVDSSKFGETAVFNVGNLSEFDYLITEYPLSDDESNYMKANNINYIYAG